jgi:CspA family cold shock protein
MHASGVTPCYLTSIFIADGAYSGLGLRTGVNAGGKTVQGLIEARPQNKVVIMETAQIEKVRVDSGQHAPADEHTGTVKWFNPGKGYGFIAPEEGGDDIFVHISAVQRAGLRKLNEGERIRFVLQQREGRVAAIDLHRLN